MKKNVYSYVNIDKLKFFMFGNYKLYLKAHLFILFKGIKTKIMQYLETKMYVIQMKACVNFELNNTD